MAEVNLTFAFSRKVGLNGFGPMDWRSVLAVIEAAPDAALRVRKSRVRVCVG
jgi:hypothetical protein